MESCGTRSHRPPPCSHAMVPGRAAASKNAQRIGPHRQCCWTTLLSPARKDGRRKSPRGCGRPTARGSGLSGAVRGAHGLLRNSLPPPFGETVVARRWSAAPPGAYLFGSQPRVTTGICTNLDPGVVLMIATTRNCPGQRGLCYAACSAASCYGFINRDLPHPAFVWTC